MLKGVKWTNPVLKKAVLQTAGHSLFLMFLPSKKCRQILTLQNVKRLCQNFLNALAGTTLRLIQLLHGKNFTGKKNIIQVGTDGAYYHTFICLAGRHSFPYI